MQRNDQVQKKKKKKKKKENHAESQARRSQGTLILFALLSTFLRNYLGLHHCTPNTVGCSNMLRVYDGRNMYVTVLSVKPCTIFKIGTGLSGS